MAILYFRFKIMYIIFMKRIKCKQSHLVLNVKH